MHIPTSNLGCARKHLQHQTPDNTKATGACRNQIAVVKSGTKTQHMLLTNVFCRLVVCCLVQIECCCGGGGETYGGCSSVAMPATNVVQDAAPEGGVVVGVVVLDVALLLEVVLVGE